MRHKQISRLGILASLAFIGGCADLMGAMLSVKPGETVKLIAASANQATYEYTHSYSWELQAVGRMAQEQCSRFRKNAELGPVSTLSLDRSRVTFYCN